MLKFAVVATLLLVFFYFLPCNGLPQKSAFQDSKKDGDGGALRVESGQNASDGKDSLNYSEVGDELDNLILIKQKKLKRKIKKPDAGPEATGARIYCCCLCDWAYKSECDECNFSHIRPNYCCGVRKNRK